MGESSPRSPCLKRTLCFSISVNSHLSWNNLRLQLWVLVSFNSVKSRLKPPNSTRPMQPASQPHACWSSLAQETQVEGPWVQAVLTAK